MKTTARALLAVSILGIGAVLSGSALAQGARMGTGGLPTLQSNPCWGTSAYNGFALPTYDGYAFAYECRVYTGRDVTAVAVELNNRRFRHRRVVGPGVAYYHVNYPYW